MLTPQEQMLLDSIAIANAKEDLDMHGTYESEHDEDGDDAKQLAEDSYKLALAFVKARRRVLEE